MSGGNASSFQINARKVLHGLLKFVQMVLLNCCCKKAIIRVKRSISKLHCHDWHDGCSSNLVESQFRMSSSSYLSFYTKSCLILSFFLLTMLNFLNRPPAIFGTEHYQFLGWSKTYILQYSVLSDSMIEQSNVCACWPDCLQVASCLHIEINFMLAWLYTIGELLAY